jgi:hypothetical protein
VEQIRQAVEAVNPRAWAGRMPRQARDVELIRNPKKDLERLTGRGGARRYEESDSPRIAANVRRLALPATGTSASYDRFLARARAIR